MTIDDDKETRRVRAFSVAISNNPYSEEPSLVLRRNALDTGKLVLYISKHRSGLQSMWVLLRAAFGQWSSDPNFGSVSGVFQKIFGMTKRPYRTVSSTQKIRKPIAIGVIRFLDEKMWLSAILLKIGSFTTLTRIEFSPDGSRSSSSLNFLK